MKYLVLIAIVVVAYLFWRNARLQRRSDAPPSAAEPLAPPQEMVSCPVCGLHLPKGDAVTGSNGLLYCSKEHRLRAGS
jgi:uncharacterized protein